ncbi:MAG TPA: sulfur carrier protein ThiS adenylyltransferase ThiF [Bacteroidota bacterium]
MRFEELKRILKQKTVGIAGCGGLGSNAAIALARVGIGSLVIADHDKVEACNLNRQYYFCDQIGMSKAIALKENIRKVNPLVEVAAHIVELTPKIIVDLFSRCDVILEAFDAAEMKEMIIECVQTTMPERPVISGVGMAGWGNNELIRSTHSGTLHVIGDQLTEATDENPPLAPRVGIVANMMANTALELLLGSE